MSDLGNWSEALERAALPDASRIVFGRSTNASDQSVSYSMNSYDAEGQVIGDDRDYDLLKAVFTPLEALSNDMDGDFMLEMDLSAKQVRRLPSS